MAKLGWIVLLVGALVACTASPNVTPTPVTSPPITTPSPTVPSTALATASASPAGQPIELFTVYSLLPTQTGPTAPSVFTFAQDTYVTSIQTYHFGDQGAPGTIGLESSAGTTLGPWQASGAPGQGGVDNAYWQVPVNQLIPAGEYTIVDSKPSTWSIAADTGGRGICWVFGFGTATPSPTAPTTPAASPTAAAPVTLFTVYSILAVGQGPTAPSVFTFDADTFVTRLETYHWNSHGHAPGTIALESSDGTTYGPWQAIGAPGMGGRENAYWEASVNQVIPSGEYTIVDSDPSTWSVAADTDGRGICAVFGYPPGTVPPSPGPSATASAPAQTGILAIEAGDSHTCALVADGRVMCWGLNEDGQLGDGSNENRSTPVEVAGLSDATAISAGTAHTCALRIGGRVSCWGYNSQGQLGDGSTESSSTPVEVTGLSSVTAISTGRLFTCALLDGGGVSCWGDNQNGALGNGSAGLEGIPTPADVVALTDATAVDAGDDHACAIRAGGRVSCWGSNTFGELGDGTTNSHYSPVEVPGLSDATAIDAGGAYTCAVVGGRVSCWGSNGYGELGNGSTSDSVVTPVEALGVTGAVEIAAGSSHTCAVLAAGQASCWGWNERGQLGDGSTTDRLAPIEVAGLSGATAITAGYAHTCALTSDGRVYCWGSNHYDTGMSAPLPSGQLGDGTTKDRSTPVEVVGLAP